VIPATGPVSATDIAPQGMAIFNFEMPLYLYVMKEQCIHILNYIENKR
jgi:hypothetical protein